MPLLSSRIASQLSAQRLLLQTNNFPRFATTAGSKAKTKSAPVITWTEFFAARKSRRIFERAGGVVGGLSGFIGGSVYFFAIVDIDPFQPILGMDPSAAYSVAPFLVGAAGVGLGMSLGGISWRAVQKSGVVRQIDQREKEFFHRIARNRPQELRSSFNNPVPDYYGEKITSVAEYRGWLRRQRRYRAVTAAGGVVGAQIGAIKLGNSALRPAKVMGDAAAKPGSGPKVAGSAAPSSSAYGATTKTAPNVTNRASKRRV